MSDVYVSPGNQHSFVHKNFPFLSSCSHVLKVFIIKRQLLRSLYICFKLIEHYNKGIYSIVESGSCFVCILI